MLDTLLPTASEVPSSLREHEQWLCWRTQQRDGKQTKIPVDPSTGQYGSSTDAETWTEFATAREYAASTDVDGIGFVFTDDDPFVGVDLDDCRVPESQTVLDWADTIVERLESYTELSPSGTGLHVIVEGELPEGRNRKGDVELYETARFFTVTGAHVTGTPARITERTAELAVVHEEFVGPDQDDSLDTGAAPSGSDDRDVSHDISDETLLNRARNASNGAKFTRLWRGDTSGYESHSEADMALCSLLAFWTGGDEAQVDRLFRESGLLREKWDEIHYSDGSTYGEKTVARAVAGTDEYYEPSSRSDGDSEPSAAETGRSVHTLERELATLEEREAERLAQVEELQTALQELRAENDHLREELEAEREARLQAEAELEEIKSASLWEHATRLWR